MKNIIVILLLIVISVGIGLYLMPKPQLPSNKNQGEVLIGGDFTLMDQHGKQIQDSDFRGKLMLVFFGFTHCPNICPTDLFIMSEAINLLGKDSKDVAPIFITVDPERDTSEVLANYLNNFSKSLIGLTGTTAQIEQVTSNYRIYYAKAKDENSSLEYTMDHSTFTYLMDRNGKYITHFAHNTNAQEMSNTIRKYLR